MCIAANRPRIPGIVLGFDPLSWRLDRDTKCPGIFLKRFMSTTERVDSEVDVIHMFSSDSNDLSSYSLACGLVASVFLQHMQLQ